MKLVTAAQMREIDRRAIEDMGVPSILLMENAGAAVARVAEEWVGPPGPLSVSFSGLMVDAKVDGAIVVLCGKGNNAGDGFVAARHLANRGHPVVCLLTCNPDDLQGDARLNYGLAQQFAVPMRMLSPDEDLTPATLIVDALLGTGSSGTPRGLIAKAIEAANESSTPILAVDLPSGLNSNTGQDSKTCIRAAETVTLGLPKTGLAQFPGRHLAGRITVADIGLPPSYDGAGVEWLSPNKVERFWMRRSPTAHKGDSGRVLLLAGSPGLTGAAAMSANAALRGGAGLVTVGVPQSLRDPMAIKLTEAMSLPLPETSTGALGPDALPLILEKLSNLDALAVGPGLGRDPAAGELVRALLKQSQVPMVVDADGLNLVAPAKAKTFPKDCVITPHPGEMARLLGTTIEEVQSDRLACAQMAAKKLGCVVVLKGPATVIASPEGESAINSSGGPALATGGTGDILTGLIAAVLARKLPPYQSALAGVYLHGIAGEIAEERFGAPGAIAGDVLDTIPEAIRRVQSRRIAPPCRMI